MNMKKKSTLACVFKDGFNRFAGASEQCGYSDLTTVINESGGSAEGRPRLSEIGN